MDYDAYGNPIKPKTSGVLLPVVLALLVSGAGNYWLWKERSKLTGELFTATSKLGATNPIPRRRPRRRRAARTKSPARTTRKPTTRRPTPRRRPRQKPRRRRRRRPRRRKTRRPGTASSKPFLPRE